MTATASSSQGWKLGRGSPMTGWKSIFRQSHNWKGEQAMRTINLRALVLLAMISGGPKAMASEVRQAAHGKYAEVNGLKMYYEIHGSGKPLVLIHGAFGTTAGWSTVLPTLEKNHQVIAVELQGHGHTADRETPFSMEQMADDVAELLKALKIPSA